VFHYFTIKFHFYFFASFCFKFFASLHLSNFRFQAKQSEAKVKSIFSLFFAFFRYFSHFFAFFPQFFAFFRFFCFKFFTSLRFSNFCFEAKQNEAKFKYIFSLFSLFSLFFLFFRFFHFFSLNFRFASIFSLNFCLFYLRFRFRFLVFRIKVNHVKSDFFSLPSETKFSLQILISLPKRK
jgi:hypothetical protein